ncbi:transposase [Metallosphaera hakonensis]|uniref:ISNCY family transposase n=1 Tax=Metallosphaera hakonensis JCM 8857 = DSM 7519 TaxID=1293036 RepID=A0A2U9IRU3_9CREN|nr:transposase [Metallosphaera hakonensis]AWR98707.1 transposase [Metallosphaera hakonensis JCM 8857 = DSM 7519]
MFELETKFKRLVKEILSEVKDIAKLFKRSGVSEKIFLSFVFYALLEGRSSVMRISREFGINYENALKVLGKLEGKWRKYLELLKEQIKGPVTILIDDTFSHKPYARLRNSVSNFGNYAAWCNEHKRFEAGVSFLTVILVDSEGGTSPVCALPYASRRLLDMGIGKEFNTKIDMVYEVVNYLKFRFNVKRIVFDSRSEKLVTDNVISELKSNRRILELVSASPNVDVEGCRHVKDLPEGEYIIKISRGSSVIEVKLVAVKNTGSINYVYSTNLKLSASEILREWKSRWNIEKFHRDLKSLGLEDTSFKRRDRLEGFAFLHALIARIVRNAMRKLGISSIEELHEFFEHCLHIYGGLLNIIKGEVRFT